MAALLQGRSVSEAARSAGVHRGTVSCWLSLDPVFSGRLKELKADLLRQVVATVRNESLNSLRFLAEVRDNKRVPMAQRVRAAQSLLDMAGIEEPKGRACLYTPQEEHALNMLALRKADDALALREENNWRVKQEFCASVEGKQLGQVRKKLDQFVPRYHKLNKRVVELDEFFKDMRESQAAQHPDYAAWNTMSKQRSEMSNELSELLEELDRLEKVERAMLDKLVDHPVALADEFEALSRLCRAYGPEKVASVAREIDGYEGHSAEIGAILASRAQPEMDAAQEQARTAAAERAKLCRDRESGTGDSIEHE